jgi:hypothetical protein
LINKISTQQAALFSHIHSRIAIQLGEIVVFTYDGYKGPSNKTAHFRKYRQSDEVLRGSPHLQLVQFFSGGQCQAEREAAGSSLARGTFQSSFHDRRLLATTADLLLTSFYRIACEDSKNSAARCQYQAGTEEESVCSPNQERFQNII